MTRLSPHWVLLQHIQGIATGHHHMVSLQGVSPQVITTGNHPLWYHPREYYIRTAPQGITPMWNQHKGNHWEGGGQPSHLKSLKTLSYGDLGGGSTNLITISRWYVTQCYNVLRNKMSLNKFYLQSNLSCLYTLISQRILTISHLHLNIPFYPGTMKPVFRGHLLIWQKMAICDKFHLYHVH